MDGSTDFKFNVGFEIGFGFSPLGDIVPEAQRSGRRERGFPVLHYNPFMPIKNVVTEQRITKEKLQRARELRRDMTPAEKFYGMNCVQISWAFTFGALRLRHLPQIRR